MHQPISGEHELVSSIHSMRPLWRARNMRRVVGFGLYILAFLLFAAWGVRDAHRGHPAKCDSALRR
jgi:flagellar biogenesis protein FliO